MTSVYAVSLPKQIVDIAFRMSYC